jgi:putative transcriptional regulator
MLSWHVKGLILIAAAVALSATVLHAALPTDAEIGGRTSLAGQLLVAAPDQHGTAFDRTVILMVRHNKEGAVGIVINRPGARRPIAEVLAQLGGDVSGVTGEVRVFAGGPFDTVIAFAVHSGEYRHLETMDIDGRMAMSGAAEVLRDLGLGHGPRKSLIAFGYAGWAPEQLEQELANGFWLVVPEDPALVFDDDRAKVWAEALALHRSAH